MDSKFSRRFRKDDEHMGKHINLFETKTKEELLELYKEFLEVEKKAVISDDSELGKIKTEYEKDFGANTVLMLQIELTHAISDMWYKENIKQPIDLDFYMEKQLENIVQLLYNGRKQIKGSDTYNTTTKSKGIL